jgi:hypothetical protein
MKQQVVENWLASLGKQPTEKEIFAEFSPDLESVVIAYAFSGLPLPDELQAYCRGIPLDERLEKYSREPLLFTVFIRQDLKTAIEIYRINRDVDGLAKTIVNDWKDEIDYLDLIKNAEPFVGNSFEVTFRKIILNDEKGFLKSIHDDFHNKIASGNGLDFKDDLDKGLFYFLNLEEFAEYSQSDLKDMSIRAEDYEDYLVRDVNALGKIAGHDILFTTLQGVQSLFGEPILSIDEAELKKGAKDLLIDGLEDLEDTLGDELQTLIGGRSLAVAKILYKVFKYSKKGSKLLEDLEVSFDQADEKDFYDRFMSQYTSGLTIKDFFINEIKYPLQKFYVKNRMDMSSLGESFFEQQFLQFMNSRFYSKIYSLTQAQQNEIEEEGHKEKRDNLVFLYVSRKNLHKEDRQQISVWDF